MKSFQANMSNLYEMLQFIKKDALFSGFDENQATKIELVTEEALVNIINHGYLETEGKIDIDCEHLSNGIKIVIQDDGIPYNPLLTPKESTVAVPVEERPLGGYGVHFILTLMDDVAYERKNDKNILTLIKFKK